MSNINPYNIDGTFPVAGQDNDSQGFRDNFTNIRNNLSYAYSELTDLQSKAIVTSALTGATITNNMGYNQIKYAQLFSPSYTYLDNGTWSSSSAFVLDYSLGNAQKLATNGLLTLSFNASTWPASGQFAVIRFILQVTNVAHTLTLPITSPGVTKGLNDIAGANTTTGVITFDQVGTYAFEFSTVDAGANITIKDISRNNATLRDPNLYFNNSVTPTLFVGFGSAINTAIAADAGRDTIVADGAYSSISVGNLSLANVTYSLLDTGDSAGYNLTSARGNLTTGSILPVQTGDQLGYINAVTFTGNGSGNAFTQISRIDFHATGSNVTYGLGGNIAFYTAQQGNGTNNNAVSQAIGIENDQSVAHFGNVLLSSTGSGSSYVPLHNTSNGTPGQLAWSTSGGVTWVYICYAANQWQRFLANSVSW